MFAEKWLLIGLGITSIEEDLRIALLLATLASQSLGATNFIPLIALRIICFLLSANSIRGFSDGMTCGQLEQVSWYPLHSKEW
jgi:hypothetical protein